MLRFHENIRYQNTSKHYKSCLAWSKEFFEVPANVSPTEIHPFATPWRTWGLVKCAPIGLHRPAGSYHIATTAMPTKVRYIRIEKCSIMLFLFHPHFNVDQCWSMMIHVDQCWSFIFHVPDQNRNIMQVNLPIFTSQIASFFPGLWLLGRRLSWVLHGGLRLGLPRSTIAISEYPCSIWIPATSKIWRFPKNGTSPEINDL